MGLKKYKKRRFVNIMGKKYTEGEIKRLCKEYLDRQTEMQNKIKIKVELGKLDYFYKAPFVNYRGTINGKKYTEIVSEFILDNIHEFESIESITRQKSYKIEHKGEYDSTSNREEEILAIQMYNYCKDNSCVLGNCGKVIGYQIPLKDKQTDKAGKIDLLSKDESKKVLYILELKRKASDENMLRAVLASYTYSKIVDEVKILKDFGLENYEIKSAPLVWSKGKQKKEYEDERNNRSLLELMKKLDVKPFFYDSDNTFFIK